MNYTCLVPLFTLLFALFVSGSLKALNPYRHSWELLLQEPSSGPYTREDAAAVQELWLTQNLDHFEAGDNRTWQMVSNLAINALIINFRLNICFPYSVIFAMLNIISPRVRCIYFWAASGPLRLACSAPV